MSLSLSLRNNLRDTARNNGLPAIWASLSPFKQHIKLTITTPNSHLHHFYPFPRQEDCCLIDYFHGLLSVYSHHSIQKDSVKFLHQSYQLSVENPQIVSYLKIKAKVFAVTLKDLGLNM